MDRLRYSALRLGSGLARRLGRRLTPAGWLACSGLIASAALGIDTNATTAYQAFTFLLALLVLASLSGLLFRPRLRLRRSLPPFGTVGQPLPYSVRVENLGGAALRGLVVGEDPPDPRPAYAEFQRARAPAGARWFGRLCGYSRWLGLIADRRTAVVAQAPLPDLPPGGRCEASLRLEPLRRGLLKLPGLAAARPDCLGLWRASCPRTEPGAVLILPRRYPAPGLALAGSRRYQQGGVALSSSVGESQEFISLRDYRPGDPLRRIHWKSLARTGRLIVKEYQDEYFVRHALVLDTFAEPGATFEAGVSVAASLACSVLTQESLLDLLFVGDAAYCVTAGRSLGGEQRLLELLACVGPCRDKPFSVLENAVLLRRSGVSACLCVLLGWDEPRRSLVRRLRAQGLQTVALVVTDPGDASPLEAAGGPLQRIAADRVAEGLAAVRL
ncbi:MAG: DUF58 domain-containing protein [Elusimicrobia bacterium]|nr:DUF58 domain-containing protein [Elusimicrobiota bacterium]